MKHKALTIILTSLIAGSVFADNSLSESRTTLAQNGAHNLKNIGLSHFTDDVAPNEIDKVKLTEEQLQEAKTWELSEDEEKRYVLLMQRKSRVYYQGLRLTPVDILALNARSEKERMHFARIAVKQEAQKVAQNIAWNVAFHKASKKETEGVPVVGDFDKRPYSPYAYKPILIHKGDVLNFFVTIDSPVKTIIAELINAIELNPGTSLNLFVVGADGYEIQDWANGHSIPPILVKGGQITLNKGENQLATLGVKSNDLPKLILVREGSSSFVNLEKF